MLILQVLVSAALLILIWLIQLLHYPFFRYIESAHFSQAMEFHQHRISLIVIPLMFAELGLAFYAQDLITLCLLGVIWLSTFTLQVPIHNKLLLGKDIALIERLVNTNWIRTICWSLKFCLLLQKVTVA